MKGAGPPAISDLPFRGEAIVSSRAKSCRPTNGVAQRLSFGTKASSAAVVAPLNQLRCASVPQPGCCKTDMAEGSNRRVAVVSGASISRDRALPLRGLAGTGVRVCIAARMSSVEAARAASGDCAASAYSCRCAI